MSASEHRRDQELLTMRRGASATLDFGEFCDRLGTVLDAKLLVCAH